MSLDPHNIFIPVHLCGEIKVMREFWKRHWKCAFNKHTSFKWVFTCACKILKRHLYPEEVETVFTVFVVIDLLWTFLALARCTTVSDCVIQYEWVESPFFPWKWADGICQRSHSLVDWGHTVVLKHWREGGFLLVLFTLSCFRVCATICRHYAHSGARWYQ